MVRRLGYLAVAAALTGAAVPASAGPIAAGDGEQTAKLGGVTLAVFTYRPRCPNPSLLIVLHGLNRNADRYRDYARGLGDRLCAIVAAPLFDKERFPTWRFQRGGIASREGVEPSRNWTGNLVLELAASIRAQEGRALPYSMIGHSAGGQFLSRIAAFTPNDARRMVIANPSTYVFPTLAVDAPYGLGGVFRDTAGEAQLRRYLAAPATIFLGEEDVESKDRNDSRAARAQGETRYRRGLNAFAAGQRMAKSRGWPFNWRLVELPGVGHSARKMFSSQEAIRALAP